MKNSRFILVLSLTYSTKYALRGRCEILRIAPAAFASVFRSAPDPFAEGAFHGKASHADQATALAAHDAQPVDELQEAPMLSLTKYEQTEMLGWAALLTLAVLNCFR